jgi:hypothetical protein
MTVLDCPIPKEDCLRKVSGRNGVSPSPAKARDWKTVAEAGRWEPAVQKIVAFQHLRHDWDGLGSVPPSRELMASAIGLVYLLSAKGVVPPNGVVPGLDGSVNFEWQAPDGTIAEGEIDRPLQAEVMEPAKPGRFWTLPTDYVFSKQTEMGRQLDSGIELPPRFCWAGKRGRATRNSADDCPSSTVVAQRRNLPRIQPLAKAPPGFVQRNRLRQVNG